MTGKELRALRKELEKRIREKTRRTDIGITQEALARVAHQIAVRSALSPKMISNLEAKKGGVAIDAVSAGALEQTVRWFEEHYGLGRKGELPMDLKPVRSLDTYPRLSTMDTLAEDQGYPRADLVQFDAVVFRPNEQRLEAMLQCTVPADRWSSHGVPTPPDREDVLKRKNDIAVALSIKLKGLRWNVERARTQAVAQSLW